MLRTQLIAVLVGAASLAPVSANSHESASGLVITPLGTAIAAQGNEALRANRREARLCLRSQKPVPLDALIDVKRQVAPTEVVQAAL
jgi:hypothetical protein